jgi:hypothetical protein
MTREEPSEKTTLSPLIVGQSVLDLARAINFEGVVNHHADAVDQLNASLSAIVGLIGQGELQALVAERSKSANETTAAPAPEKTPVAEAPTGSLAKALGGIGLAQRLGHVFIAKRKPSLQPLKVVPDVTGLPSFQACIAPSWSPVDGAHGIFITARAIITAVYPLPFETNRWQVRESHTYESREEMIEVIQTLMAHKG